MQKEEKKKKEKRKRNVEQILFSFLGAKRSVVVSVSPIKPWRSWVLRERPGIAFISSSGG